MADARRIGFPAAPPGRALFAAIATHVVRRRDVGSSVPRSDLLAEAAGAPASTRSRAASDELPHTMRVRAVFIVLLCGLLAGTLLNADALMAGAEQKPFGPERDFWLQVWRPFVWTSDRLYLNRPRRALAHALGHGTRAPVHVFELPPPSLDRMAPETAPLDVSDVVVPPPGDAAPEPLDVPAAIAPSPPPRRLRAPTVDEPLKLWVGGDSMSGVFGTSLARLASDTGLITPETDTRVSSGLTRPDFFDWPGHLHEVATHLQPDVIVVMFGANDAQGLVTPEGKVFQFYTDGWRAEYRRRVAGTMDLLKAPGRLVVWVGQPIMESDGFNDRIVQMNAIYREEAEKRAWVLFADTWPVLADVNGAYSAYLPDGDGNKQLMRAGDGIHLSRAGGDRMAAAVLALIAAETELAKAP
jgi:hypothetical protein